MTRIAILGDGLLGRTLFDRFSIHDFVENHKYPLGYHCTRHAAYCQPEPGTVMLGHADFDIRDYDSIVKALTPHKPDVLINTVAYHNVGLCEKDPALAFEVNARGAERVASILPTVYISTDYVFSDGGPHDEVLPGRQPRNVYGRSKLAGELATLEKDGIVVRVSGLYGHYDSHKGPSFPETMLTWRNVELPDDQVFSPTYAPDAAERIADIALHISDPGEPNGIYHAANAGSVSWAAFGEEVRSIAGLKRAKVLPVVRKDPIRPTNSSLRSTRLPPLRHWRVALDEWYSERQRLLVENREVSPLRAA